jgi:hypothetical protein
MIPFLAHSHSRAIGFISPRCPIDQLEHTPRLAVISGIAVGSQTLLRRDREHTLVNLNRRQLRIQRIAFGGDTLHLIRFNRLEPLPLRFTLSTINFSLSTSSWPRRL